MSNVKIGLLDFGLRSSSMNSLVKINDMVNYAIQADKLGFSRLWVAEHYFSKLNTAWTDPIPLIPLLCTKTKRIRIGTGGILLRVHAPLQVATSFKLYDNIFGGRIDLGLVNGGAFNDKILEFSSINNQTFDQAYEAVLYLLRNEKKLADEGVILPPYGGSLPMIWSMSSSIYGFERAIKLRTNFVWSIFHNNANISPNKELLKYYCSIFKNQYNFEPKICLAISGSCQKSHSKARSILNKLNLNSEIHFAGDRQYFFDTLMRIVEDYGINEIIIKDIAKETKDRIENLELLSEMFSLKNASEKAEINKNVTIY